jgi:hypothetical protein
MKRILMFAPFFPPKQDAEAITNGKLVLAMLKKGWKVDVITMPHRAMGYANNGATFFSYAEEVSLPVPKSIPKWLSLFRDRIRATVKARHSISGITWTDHAYMAGLKLSIEKTYDVILSRCWPGEAHLPALRLSRKTGIPWVANWNDPWPPEVNPPPYGFGPKRKLSMFKIHYLRDVCRTASHHTFPSAGLRDYMGVVQPAFLHRASVIPHIAFPRQRSAEATCKETFVICHAGFLGTNRDPSTFFDGLRRFVSGMHLLPKIKVVFLGNSYTFEESRAIHIPDPLKGMVEVLPWADYETSMDVMATASVLLLIEGRMNEGIYLPSKLADYAETGRPILAMSPLNGTVADLIRTLGGGVLADQTSPDSVAESIERLYRPWLQGSLEKKYDGALLLDYFSETSVLSKYQDLFGALGIKGYRK